jgi:hypothetical protein
MEELKILVGMVAGLPSMALWVAVLFFGYKVAVVGSIYGVIRFSVDKLHSVLVTRKTREVEYKEIRAMIDGICVTGAVDPLIAQLHRLKPMSYTDRRKDAPYIHANAVDWLRGAIDEKMEREKDK